MIENKITELWDGEYNDYRGVIYDNKSILERINLSNLNKEVCPFEVSCAYNYISLGNPENKEVLSDVYFECPGSYSYKYNNGNEDNIQTAITYISGNPLLNIYIEHENRFIQSLISIINLSNISKEEAETYLLDKIVIEATDGGGITNLNIFADSNRGLTDEEDISVELVEHIRDYFAAICSDIGVSDLDGNMIIKNRFSDGELLNMISSVKEIEANNSNFKSDIALAKKDVDDLEELVSNLRSEVRDIEGDIEEGSNLYNEIIDQINAQKDTLDEAYRDYIKSKEIYFYCNNIYLEGGNTNKSVEMYKEQLLNYEAKKSEAEERYRILKAIKMKNGRIGVDDELAGISDELNERDSILNESEEALQLFKIFKYLFDNRMNVLESKLKSIEKSLDSGGSDILKSIKDSIEDEINLLRSIDQQYTNIDFDRDSKAYTILYEGFRDILSEGHIDSYINTLKSFIEDKRDEIFTNTNDKSLSMMVVELENYVKEQKARNESFIEGAIRRYKERYNDFVEEKLLKYTNYVSRLKEYEIESDVTGREIGFLLAGLNKDEKKRYDSYMSDYKNRWDEIDLKNIDAKYHPMLLLEKRKEELEDLKIVYKLLTGTLSIEELKEDEKNRWEDDPEQLKERYGITDEDILKCEDIINEGVILESYDFSDSAILKSEIKREDALFEEVKQLDYYNTITMNNLFNDMLEKMKIAYNVVGDDRAWLKRCMFDLQVRWLIEEKSRFNGKVALGRDNGLNEWDNQFIKMRGGYNRWLKEMNKRLNEGGDEWDKKEVEYVRKRDEWINKVKENQIPEKGEGLIMIEEEIDELGNDISVSVKDMGKNEKELERRYINMVTIPQWISDYDVLANRTFGYLKKTNLGDDIVEESIGKLRENIESFKDNKESLEAERLYFKLQKVRQMVIEEVRNTDEMNNEMLDEIMDEADFTKRGSGYERDVLVDYSLLGGEKRETKKIGLYSTYSLKDRYFNLANVEELKGLSDSTEREIFLLKETERLREEKKEVLGTKEHVGNIYVKHIGRFPTAKDTGKYIEEKSEKRGLFGGIQKIFGRVINSIASLFGKKGEEKEEDFSEFQKRLQGAIKYGSNKNLETGKIMLEYQRIEVIEAGAEEKKEEGTFNVPLFPGGPSIKTIGSVAISVATGGVGGLVAGLGWNAATTLTTVAEGKMDNSEGALSIFKDATSLLLSSKIGGLTNMIKNGIGIGSNIYGVISNAAIDMTGHVVSSTTNSMVNSIELNRGGGLTFNSHGFGAGLGTGLVSSFGTFGGSFGAGIYDVGHNATWSNGGFNYNIMRDSGSGIYISDYFNQDMKRMGGMIGGLTEAGINNVTGVGSGFTFNVLNSRDFGFKNEVGMLSVSLGGNRGFDWDVSTGGLDISASEISSMVSGIKRAGLYDTVMNRSEEELKKAYIIENFARYSNSKLNNKELYNMVCQLDDYLNNEKPFDIDLKADENNRRDEIISLDESLSKDFKVEDKIIQWDLNSAAKLTSIFSHEWKHDGINNTNFELEKQEDIKCHTFDTKIWEGLKNSFVVRDWDMDMKLEIYKKGNNQIWDEYLNDSFALGEEHSLKSRFKLR